MTNDWLNKVYEAVSSVPKGRVVSYGQVAARIGSPRASRMIGWALSRLPYETKVPWHRVVNRKGELSIVHAFVRVEDQANLLMKEGVIVKNIDGILNVDMKKYLFVFNI